jgi:hypothetical protein
MVQRRIPGLAVVSLALFLVHASLHAQGRSEIAFSGGGGSLFVDRSDHFSSVFSFSYLLHITDHISAEGALDFFTYKFLTGPSDQPYEYTDGYTGAEVAVVYHFRKSRQVHKWLPYVAAGVGKTTTDFTEIPGTAYYRFGAGVSYNVSDRLGTRIELRNETIRGLGWAGRTDANLPSLRCGIVLRF